MSRHVELPPRVLLGCLLVATLPMIALPPLLERAAAQAPPSGREGPPPYLLDRAVALCIGVNKYADDRIESLQFAEADALAVAELLRVSYGFTPDTSLVGERATRSGILSRLDEYARTLGEHDALLVFFAMHGKVLDGPAKPDEPPLHEGFLVPQDAKLDLKDNRDIDAWRQEAIGMRTDLLARLAKMNARHVLFIVDSCSSGYMTQRGEAFPDRTDLHMLLNSPSRAAMSATTADQRAFENPDRGHGYFTAELLNVLKDLAKRREAASLTDVFEEVRKKVASPEGKGMLPQLNNRLGSGDGEFVFLPKTLRKSDIDFVASLAERGQGAGEGRGHILTPVLDRMLERQNLRVSSQELIEVAEARDYHFASDAASKEAVWKKKFDRLRTSAAGGDANALAALAFCYAKGLGTGKDSAAAYHWARQAYDTGLPAGKHVMAVCLSRGLSTEANEVAAERLYRAAAEAGFPLSNYVVAGSYTAPKGEPLDADTVALMTRLYDIAAKGGVARAKTKLANVYAGTLPGTSRDMGRAIQLLREASQAGDAEADLLLYDILSGQDPHQAHRSLLDGAERGDAECQCYIACEYYPSKEGHPNYGSKPRLNLPRNPREAVKWAELSAAQGYNPARMFLCELYQGGERYQGIDGLPSQPERARELCELSARDNYGPAFVKQGIWYSDGMIYERDYRKAFANFQKGASAGDPMAYSHLARLYENALGVELGDFTAREMIPELQYHAIHCYIQCYARFRSRGIANPAVEQKLRNYAGQVRNDRSTLNRLMQQYPDSYKIFLEIFLDK